MPIQLPVVVSQTAASDPDQREFEETLVQHLILDQRADVRLIKAIENIAPDSSDQLMLDGIDRDFVFLSWLAPSESHTHLQRIGIHGRRAAHRGDQDARQEQGRRIYFIDLANCDGVEEVVGLIQDASRDRQTSAVQIGNLTPPTGRLRASEPLPVIKQPATLNPPLQQTAADPTHIVAEPSQIDDDHLESLVDELDRLDW